MWIRQGYTQSETMSVCFLLLSPVLFPFLQFSPEKHSLNQSLIPKSKSQTSSRETHKIVYMVWMNFYSVRSEPSSYFSNIYLVSTFARHVGV